MSDHCCECNSPSEIRGLCTEHYHYWRLRVIERLTTWIVLERIGRARPLRDGEVITLPSDLGKRAKTLPKVEKIKRTSDSKTCLRCDQQAKNRGLCMAHMEQYRRLVRKGETTMSTLEAEGKVLPVGGERT